MNEYGFFLFPAWTTNLTDVQRWIHASPDVHHDVRPQRLKLSDQTSTQHVKAVRKCSEFDPF